MKGDGAGRARRRLRGAAETAAPSDDAKRRSRDGGAAGDGDAQNRYETPNWKRRLGSSRVGSPNVCDTSGKGGMNCW